MNVGQAQKSALLQIKNTQEQNVQKGRGLSDISRPDKIKTP